MSPNQLLKVVLPFLALLALSGWTLVQSRAPVNMAQAQSAPPAVQSPSAPSTSDRVNAANADAVSQPSAIDVDSLGIETNSPQPLGHAIIFTATLAGDPAGYTFNWSFGDGATAEGMVVGHVYQKPGVYEVLLIVSDGVDNVQLNTRVEVTAVSASPPVPITGLQVTTNNPVNEGDPSNFIASVETGTNVQYTWDFGDGATKTGAAVSHVYDDLGWYMAKVTARNEVSVREATVGADVIEAFVKGLRMASSEPTFLGQATTFTATVQAGSNVLFSWNFGDGAVVESAPIPDNEHVTVVQHMYMMPGKYNVSVRAFNSRNDLFNTMDNIEVRSGAPPPSECPMIVNNAPEFEGRPVIFTIDPPGSTDLNYRWDFGDGTSGRGQTVTHTYSEPGLYVVILRISNSQGLTICSTVVEILEKIEGAGNGDGDPHDVFDLSDEIEMISPNNVALPSEAIMFEIIDPLEWGWIYTWDFGDGTRISGPITMTQKVSHTYGIPGAFPVSVTAVAADAPSGPILARGFIAAITNANAFYMPTICAAVCIITSSGGGEDALPAPTPSPRPAPPTVTPPPSPTAVEAELTPTPEPLPSDEPESLPTATAPTAPTATPTATQTPGGTIPPAGSIPPPAN